jgi:hypothetical protein
MAQNACGLESLDESATIGIGISSDLLREFSSFKTIEGRSLANSNTITGKLIYILAINKWRDVLVGSLFMSSYLEPLSVSY